MFQLNLVGSKPLIAEGSTEASPSPAADYLGGKTAGGKVRQGAEGFAKALEKAQKSEREPASASRPESASRKAQSPGGEKKSTSPVEAAEKLQKYLGGLDEQQLIRVLMKIKPAELLRAIESLGLEASALLSPRPSAGASGSPQGDGKWGLSRERLVRLLASLSELLGEQTVLDAIGASVGKKGSQSRNVPETESDNIGDEKKLRVGEAREVGKRARVVVLDLRKDQIKESQEQPNSMKNSFPLNTNRTVEAHQERDVALLFRTLPQDRAQTAAPQAGVPVNRAPMNFEQRFIPEVVKQTGIILKDGGNGEIRLVLKPENLGSVRIRLALSESSLEGRIVVDNNSVKELVESSLDNLKNALRLEGYQTNLEVSVGHRRNWNGNEQERTLPTGWVGGGSEEFDKAIPLYLDMRPEYEVVNVFA